MWWGHMGASAISLNLFIDIDCFFFSSSKRLLCKCCSMNWISEVECVGHRLIEYCCTRNTAAIIYLRGVKRRSKLAIDDGRLTVLSDSVSQWVNVPWKHEHQSWEMAVQLRVLLLLLLLTSSGHWHDYFLWWQCRRHAIRMCPLIFILCFALSPEKLTNNKRPTSAQMCAKCRWGTIGFMSMHSLSLSAGKSKKKEQIIYITLTLFKWLVCFDGKCLQRKSQMMLHTFFCFTCLDRVQHMARTQNILYRHAATTNNKWKKNVSSFLMFRFARIEFNGALVVYLRWYETMVCACGFHIVLTMIILCSLSHQSFWNNWNGSESDESSRERERGAGREGNGWGGGRQKLSQCLAETPKLR